MKRILCAVCLFVALGYAPAFAGFWDGSRLATYWQEYKKFNNGVQYGEFEMGSFSGYVISATDAGHGIYFHIPAGVRINQVCAVVGKWLDDHPDEWNKSAFSLTVAALNNAFPLEIQDRK